MSEIPSADNPPGERRTRLLAADANGIGQAAGIIACGGLVAFPTETVYGLGADACSPAAVASLYRAKNRPPHNPLIVHLSAASDVDRYAELVGTARELAEAFWPGPLTLVLPRRAGSALSAEVSAGLETVAVRVPANPVAVALIGKFGGALAGPSANLSGCVSPTRRAHVLRDLGGRIDAVIDGGNCEVGIESTIVGFAKSRPVLLRSGGIPASALADVLGQEPIPLEQGPVPVAPGSFMRHYATGSKLRLNAAAPSAGEGWLGFGPEPVGANIASVRENLSPSADLVEAAYRLYGDLRSLDEGLGGRGCIAVARVPAIGVGLAINDRLQRASAPKQE